MLVKNVIISASTALERWDVASALAQGDKLTEEQSQTVAALIHCYNAVEDELARLYFPLIAEYETQTENGEISYESFPHAPVRILSVEKDGKKIKYRLYPKYIKAAGKSVCVRYCYSPAKKTLDDECEVRAEVGDRLIYCGMLAEYCLISGLIESAESWESKYRAEIRSLSYAPCGKIPQRSWE